MDNSLTVRVSRSTHGRLRELSDQTGETMTDLVDRAVREYQRRRFWADYHAAYAAVRSDPAAWAELQGEIEPWDVTWADGPEDQPDGGDAEAPRPESG